MLRKAGSRLQTKPPTVPAPSPAPRHNGWLLLIAAFKLMQVLLFAAISVGAFKLMHKDLGDLISQLADQLQVNPESKLVNFLLDKADMVTDQLLKRIGVATFIYATLDLTEAIGLYLEKPWAEWLTLLVTASFLPWEIMELIHHANLFSTGLLAVNALVLFYLLWLTLRRTKKGKALEESGE